MMKRTSLPSQEELLSRFMYDPATGKLLWKTHRCSNMIGREAGTRATNGYLRVNLCKVQYAAHRIIWKMVYGTEPAEVDHIDRARRNNRLSNLRESNRALNTLNRDRRLQSSRPTGIERTRQGKFMVRVCDNYKRTILGTFVSLEEAVAVRQKYVDERLEAGV